MTSQVLLGSKILSSYSVCTLYVAPASFPHVIMSPEECRLSEGDNLGFSQGKYHRNP